MISSPDPFSLNNMEMKTLMGPDDIDNMSEISYSDQVVYPAKIDSGPSNLPKGKEKCTEQYDPEYSKGRNFDADIDTQGFNFSPQCGAKRKTEFTKSFPIKKNSARGVSSLIDIIEGPDECISTARDLLVKAAHQAESRSQQSKILDLLNIFRQFIEKDGNIQRETSVLAAQLQKLEHTAQVLQNTARQQKKPTGIEEQCTTDKGQKTKMHQQATSTPVGVGNRASAPQVSQPARTWASVAGPSNSQKETGNGWTIVQPKKTLAPKPRRSNRLILLQDATTRQTFSPLQIRDQINNAFRARGIQGPVVAIVSRTRNDNIAITTIGAYSADFLLDQVDIWKNYAPHILAMKDQPWFKVIIHGIPTEEFGEGEDLSSISEEISTFNNGLKVIGQPYWITPAENRANQKAGSIVVAFETEAQAKQATSRKLIVAGRYLPTEKYLNFTPTTQCHRCQVFGHQESRCRWEAKCQFCAGPHSTKQHACSQCRAIGTKCVHLVPKCGNCNGAHTADSNECPTKVSILEKMAAREEEARKDHEECL